MTDKLFWRTLKDFPALIKRSTLIDKCFNLQSSLNQQNEVSKSWYKFYEDEVRKNENLEMEVKRLKSDEVFKNLHIVQSNYSVLLTEFQILKRKHYEAKSFLNSAITFYKVVSTAVSPMYHREAAREMIYDTELFLKKIEK